jgi:hypothetical protein
LSSYKKKQKLKKTIQTSCYQLFNFVTILKRQFLQNVRPQNKAMKLKKQYKLVAKNCLKEK